MDDRQVDVLIATTGRRSLEQAILAAMHQTYPHTRCVVVGDGPNPKARQIWGHMTNAVGMTLYLETPERMGNGNDVKEWYINSEWAAPYIKVLDDDDWMPPCAVSEMMGVMRPGVAFVACQMFVCRTAGKGGKWMYQRTCSGAMDVNQIGCGNVLFRTGMARGIPFPKRVGSDFFWLAELSTRGIVVRLPQILYWYNGYRANTQRPCFKKK